MALGTLGSTLNDELNRLANGGTYRDMNQMVDEALAAKQWANRENINPYSTDTVGILNEIAGLGLDKKNWLDFNGVCNYIAGTTGLPAAAALRQVYPTTDLLTGVASYYVDATAPTNWGSLGYVYLNGVTGNYLSVPDAANLDITGDIDIAVRVALDDWTPSAANILASKASATGQISWFFFVNTTGVLRLDTSADGTATSSASSTVATGFADGTAGWVRVTRVASTGAINFYTAADQASVPSSWTALGTSVSNTAGNIFNSTSVVEIGSRNLGTTQLATGKYYRAQILNGIGGTTVLDVNIATDYKASNEDTFTATTGQTVTVNGVDIIANLGTAGSLLPTTLGSSTAADSNDPKFLDHTGTNYVYLPGVTGNYLTTPDASALDITGDIDLRAYVALDDWTPAGVQYLISKNFGTTERSYQLEISTTGAIRLVWSSDGTTNNTTTSTAVVSAADGSAKWVRATMDIDDGAGNRVTNFYTSDDGATWTQLGTTVTTAGATSIYSGTGILWIGRGQTGTQITTGKVYRAQVFNGIDGTTVLDVDTSVITAGSATSFTAVTGQTVTINRSTSGRKTVAVTQPTWLFGTDDYMEVNNRYMAHSTSDENYVYLSGASGNYMSVADNPPLDVTGDIDIRAYVALDDWTPAASNILISKRNTNFAYQFQINQVDGQIGLVFSIDGTTGISSLSTVGTGFTDGAARWVRATRVASTGLCQFFTSTDGNTWTQLGADVSNTAGNIFSSADAVEIGSRTGGTALNFKGKFYRGIIKNGIDGTTVLDANAATILLPSQTTFTDSSSNAYTVTINKSGVGTFVSTGNYLYLPGVASNYASAPDSAALDIVGDIDIRVKVALDDWTPSTETPLLSKWSTAFQRSYQLVLTTAGNLYVSISADGQAGSAYTATSTVATGITDGSTKWVRVTVDVDNGASGKNVQFFTSDNGTSWTQLGTTITTAGTTSLYSGTSPLEIGTNASGTGTPARGKFFRAQVLNGIGGTLAFDVNFEGSITSLNQASFTESSANAATVTINRSGSTYRSAGVIDAGYLYPGATNTFTASATDFLNFGAADSFTTMVIFRQFGTNTSYLLAKRDGTTATLPGYSQLNASGSTFFAIGDGVVSQANSSLAYVSATLTTSMGLRNVSADNIRVANNATLGTATTDSTTGAISHFQPLRIGAASTSTSSALEGEVYAAAVFRQALTTSQIRQISNYFANREVYL